MPHASDVRPTPHDDHDLLLVAALAADDLVADDRDRAMAQTRACADCANLHDDLRAIARAAASVPPPVAARPRDFRLTEADAARLRPGGWRRFLELIQGSRGAMTRPLGAGLATLGLVGLLVGNVSIGTGALSAPTTSSGYAVGEGAALPAASAGAASAPGDVALGVPASAAASAGAAPVSAGPFDPAASGKAQIAASSSGAGGAAGGALASAAADAAASGNDTTAERTPAGAPQNRLTTTSEQAGAVDPLRPLNVLSIAAIVLGLVLLVVSRTGSRRVSNRT